MHGHVNKKCKYFKDMKLKHLLVLALCCTLATCATVTPDQARSDAKTVNVVLNAGLQDFKTIKSIK